MKLIPGPNSTGKFGFRVNASDHIYVEDVGVEVAEITDEMQSYINAGFLSVVDEQDEKPVPEQADKKPKKPKKADAKPAQSTPTPDVTSSGSELDIDTVLGK